MVVGALSLISQIIIIVLLQRQTNDCIQYVSFWINPIFLALSIGSLFSAARYAHVWWFIGSSIIFGIGTINRHICLYVINVVYITYSFIIPIYIILIFFAIKELRNWKFSLISMYLVSFDVITNFVVIYYFLQNDDYFFASLQILFTFLAHIFGSFSNNLFGAEYNNLSKCDKILSFTGLGRPYFKIKSWIEVSENSSKIYTKLANKHRIWGIMFESFPSITLHLYASLIAKQFSFELITSIIVSIISISYHWVASFKAIISWW